MIKKSLFWLIVFLLPIDWFAPTGILLREAGAKPVIPVMAILSLLIFISCLSQKQTIAFPKKPALEFFIILGLGFCAYYFNTIFQLSDPTNFRDPLTQFINQFLLLALFFFVVMNMTEFLTNSRMRVMFAKALPWAALFHLVIFLLEVAWGVGVQNDWLAPFRMDGKFIDRPSGLMSEPSYFGAFAALYGMPLLFCKAYKRVIFKVLGVLLLVAATLIVAKTTFIVLAFQYLYYLKSQNKKILTVTNMLFAVIILVICYSRVHDLNVYENLSTSMRLGSALLAINVAKSHYGILGLGVGQFQFFYRQEFAPSFLFFSHEALVQFEQMSTFRASTYNFFIRLWVEVGIFGLLLFIDVLRNAFKKAWSDADPASEIGLFFLAGSIGFLMTQDTYFYPPLALGLALAFSARKHDT